MLQTLIRRAAQEGPYKPYLNPYKAKKLWPPDFTQLSQKHQFRLERRYRRRAKLAWARPRWTKIVKLATWGSIAVVVVYGILFMPTSENGSIFDGMRVWYDRLGGEANESKQRDIRAEVVARGAAEKERDSL
ncbi:hypothetical protein BDV97DRAFT_398987 [Delphinella strobiligena]|nr:hypothetical protein BDV97DRAFT_398987 [Delphinella strobiligena]